MYDRIYIVASLDRSCLYVRIHMRYAIYIYASYVHMYARAVCMRHIYDTYTTLHTQRNTYVYIYKIYMMMYIYYISSSC